MEDFEIPPSDDEWEQYIPPGDDNLHFHMRIVPLFEEIQEKKVLNLTCICPRKGKDTQQQSSSQRTVSPTQQQHEQQQQQQQQQINESNQKIIDQNKTFEAFDFDNDDANEKPSIKRQKTPASAKREKKVASMSNVMSDLLRSKKLDDLEANKTDDKETVTVKK